MVCSGRKPQHIRSDNGPEFVGKSVQKWLGQAQVGPRYIEPGAPWENAYVESSMPKCVWNCWIANSSSTCAKSMRRPATTPTNTTSNDRTAAWEKDPLPSRRSANFRSGLRPALQFALVLLP